MDTYEQARNQAETVGADALAWYFGEDDTPADGVRAVLDALLAARLTEKCGECDDGVKWSAAVDGQVWPDGDCPACDGSGTVDKGPLVLLAPEQAGWAYNNELYALWRGRELWFDGSQRAVYVERERNE